MSEKKFSADKLAQMIAGLPAWQVLKDGDGKRLVRDLKFPDFSGALRFVNQLGAEAEKAGHHPDIDIRYNCVRLALITHDTHGITAKDVALAQITESLVAAERSGELLG
jgi:4a-hydroxytetrahydrobiopterin dehydratase